MLLPPLCRLAVYGEQRHARPVRRGDGLLHPRNVRLVKPGVEIANEVVVNEGHWGQSLRGKAEATRGADGYLALSA